MILKKCGAVGLLPTAPGSERPEFSLVNIIKYWFSVRPGKDASKRLVVYSRSPQWNPLILVSEFWEKLNSRGCKNANRLPSKYPGRRLSLERCQQARLMEGPIVPVKLSGDRNASAAVIFTRLQFGNSLTACPFWMLAFAPAVGTLIQTNGKAIDLCAFFGCG